MFDLLIVGGVFVVVFSAFFVLIYFAFYRKLIRGRLEKISSRYEHGEGTFGPFNYFLVRIIKCFGRFTSPEEGERLSRTKMALFKAGYRRENAPILFCGSRTFLAILFLIIVGVLLFCFADFTNGQTMFCALLAAAAGFYLPNLWIRWKTGKRTEQIRNGFPDMLDLLVVCVGAGLGLDAALDRVGREIGITSQALGEELKLLNLEIRAGRSRKEALKDLSERTGLEEISSLVTLINQSEELGTSIIQTLRVHSDTMRTKRRMRAETIAAKIPVKLTFPLICFILPCFMVVMAGSAVISMIRVFAMISIGGN